MCEQCTIAARIPVAAEFHIDDYVSFDYSKDGGLSGSTRAGKVAAISPATITLQNPNGEPGFKSFKWSGITNFINMDS